MMPIYLDSITNSWVTRYTTENSQHTAIECYTRLKKYLDNNKLSMDNWVNSMSMSEDAKYIQVDEFLRSLKNANQTKKQTLSFIRNYLRVVHKIKLDRDDSKDFIKLPKIQNVNREPLTREIIKDFADDANKVYSTLFLIQSSSGMRISETLALTPNDFDFTYNPIKIKIRAETTKTKSERITFISKEAFKSLEACFDEFFEKRTLLAVEKYFGKLRQNLGYNDKYENSRNFYVNIHSMRAFFRTQAGKINQDFAESMIGHGYLKQYIRLDDETKAGYYKKVEPLLKIND